MGMGVVCMCVCVEGGGGVLSLQPQYVYMSPRLTVTIEDNIPPSSVVAAPL